jgi:hypothetical protein
MAHGHVNRWTASIKRSANYMKIMKIKTPTDNALRRKVARRGFKLVKIRENSSWHDLYGLFMISNASTHWAVQFGMTAEEVNEWLTSDEQSPVVAGAGEAVWTWLDARCTRFLAVNYEELAERLRAGASDEESLAWCFEHGRRPSDEDIEIWNEFMTKRGWRDNSSAALAEAKRLRGFAQRDDIQTAFEFHLADESSDETPAS